MTDFPEPTSWTEPSGNTADAAPDVPHYVGRYRIMDAIGVGSSSAVYRALDEASETEVAIKILADNYSLVTEIRQRFAEEAELLMSIRSPAVAQIYGQGETDGGQPFIVLELADRGTLGDRVEQLRQGDHAASEADLLAVGAHLAEALAAIHRADIVHRDVSPGNILISAAPAPVAEPGTGSRLTGPLDAVKDAGTGDVLRPDERYLLADLGFAKNLRQASGLTAGGGTKGFAAPEQQGAVTVVDHRADVFGATSVIAWLAEGTELLDSIKPFLDTGLAKAPEDRHQTMDGWLRDLTRRLDRRPAAFSARPVQDRPNGPGLPSVVAERSRRRAPMAALAAIGLGAIAAAIALFFTSGFGDDSEATSSEAAGSETSETPAVLDPGSAGAIQQAADASASNQAGDTATVSSTVLAPGAPTQSSQPANSEPGATSTSSSTSTPGTVTTVESPTSSTTGSASTGSSSTSRPTTTAATPTTRRTTTTSITATTATTRATTTTSTTTSTTARPTTIRTTTTRPITTRPTTVTTRPITTTSTTTTTLDTTTTTDPIYEFSPRAYFTSPVAEAQVTGNLRITGTAEYREGITGVLLTVRRDDDDFVWSPEASSFVDQWLRFPVPVTPSEANDVTWTFTLGNRFLEPGRYVLRVWARGNGANDPVSDRVEIVVPAAS